MDYLLALPIELQFYMLGYLSVRDVGRLMSSHRRGTEDLQCPPGMVRISDVPSENCWLMFVWFLDRGHVIYISPLIDRYFWTGGRSLDYFFCFCSRCVRSREADDRCRELVCYRAKQREIYNRAKVKGVVYLTRVQYVRHIRRLNNLYDRRPKVGWGEVDGGGWGVASSRSGIGVLDEDTVYEGQDWPKGPHGLSVDQVGLTKTIWPD
jgi:hypothetical protein